MAALLDEDDPLRRCARRWWRRASPRRAPGRAGCVCGQLGDLARHGGGEQQRLPLASAAWRRSSRMSWMKPMSSMRSASSSTSTSTLVEAQWRWSSGRAGGRAWRPARRRRASGRAPAVALADAADRRAARAQAQVTGRRSGSCRRSDGQLARRRRARARGSSSRSGARGGCGEPLQNRQREGGRLAGAGLGEAEEVAAGEDQRQCILLNRGGGLVVFLRKRADDRL